MALNILEQASFRLYDSLFSYMPWFPVNWDTDASKMVVQKPVRECQYALLFAVFTTVTGFSGLAVSMLFGNFFPRPYFTRVSLAVQLLGWIGCTAMAACWYVVIKNMMSILASVNGLIDLTKQVEEEYPEERQRLNNNRNQFDASILLLCGLVPTMFLTPLFIATTGVLCDVDPWFFLLEEVLPDATTRDRSTVLLLMLIRFVVIYIGFIEFARSAAFFVCTAFIALDRAYKIVYIMLVRIRNFPRYQYYYNCSILLIRISEDVIHILVYLVMTMGFWALVICGWVCVKCSPDQITYSVYIGFLMIGTVMAAGHVVALPMMCTAMDMSIYAVTVHTLRAKIRYAKKRTVVNKCCVMRAEATYPVKIKYGYFWYLCTDFMGEYVWLIMLRTFDAILLIDFR